MPWVDAWSPANWIKEPDEACELQLAADWCSIMANSRETPGAVFMYGWTKLLSLPLPPPPPLIMMMMTTTTNNNDDDNNTNNNNNDTNNTNNNTTNNNNDDDDNDNDNANVNNNNNDYDDDNKQSPFDIKYKQRKTRKNKTMNLFHGLHCSYITKLWTRSPCHKFATDVKFKFKIQIQKVFIAMKVHFPQRFRRHTFNTNPDKNTIWYHS